jgi:hypothetical protein
MPDANVSVGADAKSTSVTACSKPGVIPTTAAGGVADR